MPNSMPAEVPWKPVSLSKGRDEVPDVAEHEEVPRQGGGHAVGSHPRVGAGDEERAGALALGHQASIVLLEAGEVLPLEAAQAFGQAFGHGVGSIEGRGEGGTHARFFRSCRSPPIPGGDARGVDRRGRAPGRVLLERRSRRRGDSRWSNRPGIWPTSSGRVTERGSAGCWPRIIPSSPTSTAAAWLASGPTGRGPSPKGSPPSRRPALPTSRRSGPSGPISGTDRGGRRASAPSPFATYPG